MTIQTRTFNATTAPEGSTVESRVFRITLPRAPWEAEEAEPAQPVPRPFTEPTTRVTFGRSILPPPVKADFTDPYKHPFGVDPSLITVAVEKYTAGRMLGLTHDEGHMQRLPTVYNQETLGGRHVKTGHRAYVCHPRAAQGAATEAAILRCIGKAAKLTADIVDETGMTRAAVGNALARLYTTGKRITRERLPNGKALNRATQAGREWLDAYQAGAGTGNGRKPASGPDMERGA